MRVQLCGRLAVAGQDGDVDESLLGGRRGRLALAFLVLERTRMVDRAVLAEVLWPGGPPRTWESALRTTLSHVRAVCRAAGVADDPVETHLGALRLAVGDLWVDLEAAAEDVTRAARLLADGDAAASCEAARAALRTLDRPLLVGLDGDWVDEQRRRFERDRLGAVELLATATLAAGSASEALAVAEQGLAREPFHEPLHRTVMAAHVAMGNRAAALRAYARCRDVLVEELGVEPAPETEAAYLDLLGPDEHAQPVEGVVSELPPGLRPGDELPFVGRGGEVRLLERWWATAAQRGGAAVITGEAGVGKSRLARELAARAHADGALVLHGRCDAERSTPFQPLAEAFLRVDEPALGAVFRPAVAGDGSSDGSSPLDRVDAFDAVSGWVARRGEGGPVLLVVDDIQWADDDTLAALGHLLRRTEGAPFGVLATARDLDRRDADPLADLLASLVRADRLTGLALGELEREAVWDLLAAIGGGALDDEGRSIGTSLHDLTGGNAFFVGETLRHRLASGGLRHEGGRWSAAGDQDLVAPGVSEVVLARVRELGAGSVDALSIAAVIGQQFDLALLADALDGDLAATVDLVDRAVRSRLLRAGGDAPGRCRFAHAVVRSALLDHLTEPRRLELHRRVGLALEARPAGPERAADLAWHFLEAAPLGDHERVVRYATAAARQALSVLAYDLAASTLRRALRGPLPPPDRAHLLVELGAVESRAGEPDAAHEAFVEAARIAGELGDAPLMARAAMGAMDGSRRTSNWFPDPALREVAHRALDAIGADGDDGDEHVELRIQLLGELALWTLEPAERQALADRAMRLADEHPSVGSLLAAFGASRVAWWAPDRTSGRLAFVERTIAVAGGAGDEHRRDALELHRLSDLVQLGRLADAAAVRARLEHSPAVARSRRLRWQLRLFDAMDAMVTGDLAAGHERAAGALAMWEDSPPFDAVQAFGLQVAVLHLIAGELDQALGLAEAAASAMPDVLGFRCALASVLTLVGRSDEAAPLIEQVVADDFRGLPRDNGMPPTLHLLAEALFTLGDAEHAAALLPLAETMRGQLLFQPGPTLFLGPADQTLAILELTAGDPDRARASFESAAALATGFATPFWADRIRRRATDLLGR